MCVIKYTNERLSSTIFNICHLELFLYLCTHSYMLSSVNKCELLKPESIHFLLPHHPLALLLEETIDPPASASKWWNYRRADVPPLLVSSIFAVAALGRN